MVLGGEADGTGLCCMLGSAELVGRGPGDAEQVQPLDGGSGAEKLLKPLWTWLEMGNSLSRANWLGEAHPFPVPPCNSCLQPSHTLVLHHVGQLSVLLQLEKKPHIRLFYAAQVEIGRGEGTTMVTVLD